jgi:hypothetical protein
MNISLLRRRFTQVAFVTVAILGGLVWWKISNAGELFQRDADIVRLHHLKHYGTLIEEYHKKTGRLPFQGITDVPVYVNIANDQQAQFAKNGPPTPHKLMSVDEFVTELELGLGRKISERYDPQFNPVDKPNFYIYMVSEDYYFFAVHLSQPYPFAKKIAENYYKAEVSNVANDLNDASLPQRLFASPEFTSTLQTPLVTPGFFADREQKFETFTKHN